MAGASILVGVLGVAFGLRGSKHEQTAMTPAPVQPLPATATPVVKETQKIAVDLEADAPNAHVVFRRRVATAPATMQLAATDVVELVEVSAPGYKTQRYWLTFDRPTHLKAHLVKGAGLSEATEEETLVALGEVAAPTMPAIAAAAPQVATVARTPVVAAKPAAPQVAVATPAVTPVVTPAAPAVATPELAPRKIGRAAAEAAPETPPATTPAIAATEPGQAMPEAATTLPAPETAPATDPAPIAKTELPAATKPADEPTPAATPPDPVRPAIDNATVSSVVGAHRPEVLKCFAEGKKKDHAMKGTLAVQLAVDAGGKVKHIQVQSTINNPLVAACVVKSANAWKFPSRGGADMATVNYPFTIN